MQILTPDFSGRRPPPPPLLPSPHLPSPHLPPSPPPCLPPIFPPSLLPLRKFDSVLSSLFGMRLALRILRPHSLTLTLTLSLSHCLTVSLISLISLISFSSLSSLSLSLSLSLSPLCLSSFRLSSLSSLAGGSGQRATYKGLFTPASKKSAVFFPTSLPSTFPFWSASFRPPLASSIFKKSLLKCVLSVCPVHKYNTIHYIDSRGVQWRSPNGVGASIGDPFEGAGIHSVFLLRINHLCINPRSTLPSSNEAVERHQPSGGSRTHEESGLWPGLIRRTWERVVGAGSLMFIRVTLLALGPKCTCCLFLIVFLVACPP